MLFEKTRLITLTLDQSKNGSYRSYPPAYRNKRTSVQKNIKKPECRLIALGFCG